MAKLPKMDNDPLELRMETAMIDTIKVVKVLASPLPVGQVKWQSFKTSANGITTGVLNPTAEDRRNSRYHPNITYYERPMPRGGMRYEVGLEVSLPKLHFGNNFDELTEKDFKGIIRDLKRSLREVGFSKTFTSDLSNFEVRKVDFCKNICFEDGTLVTTVTNSLHLANISKVFDVQKTDFRNGGGIYHIHTNSEDVVFYDKIADLEQSAKSEHKSVDHTTGYCQHHLLAKIAADRKRHPLEVLRYEVRLNGKAKIRHRLDALGMQNVPLTLKGIFSQDVAKAVLLDDLDKILVKVPNAELLDTTPENLLLSILSDMNCTGPMDAFAHLGFVLAASSIDDDRRLREIVDKHFHKDAWGRLIKKYPPVAANNQLKSLLKVREEVEMG